MWQKPLHEALQNHLREIQKTRPSYSLRALARRLKIGPGALSEFLRGKRKLSMDVALRIVPLLSIDDSQREALLKMISQEKQVGRHQLSAEDFMKVAHWSAAAMMCLFEFDNPPEKIEDVAKKIGIPQEEVQKKLDSLKELGLIQEIADGKFKSKGLAVTSTEDIPNEAIVNYHKDALDLSKLAIDQVPSSEREFTSVTFSSTKDKISVAKKEIRKFREQFSSKLGMPARDEVYHLQISFFPVTNWDKKSKDKRL